MRFLRRSRKVVIPEGHNETVGLRQNGPLKLLAVMFFFLCPSIGSAQTQAEFFPEVDADVKLSPDLRFVFQAKETRESGDPTQVEIGPSIEFYLRPILKLKRMARFDLDDSKSRPLVLSVGYRYVPSPDQPALNRLEPVCTFHLPTIAHILLSDRNRFDLDWSNSGFQWRYRNRFTLERRFGIRSYHPAPYVSAEVFYENRYSKISTTALYAGCLFPLGKHAELNPYYEHENNTGKSPNRQVDAAGLILDLHFSRPEHNK